MEMSIDEHIAQLKKLKSFHNGSYGASINFAIDIMRKYQMFQDQSLSLYMERLKADMVAILEELKKSIEDKVYNVSAYSECLDCDVVDYEDVNEIIIEKINALKENTDGND